MPPTPAPVASASGNRAGMPALKLCLVGEPGAGKTSLVQRLLHGRFPATAPGPGITVSRHRLRDGIGVALWDVDGSSAIDSLSQAFLSRVDAAAVVVDGRDPCAVARALALLVQLRRLQPQAFVALLLNKCDLGAIASPGALPPGLALHEVSARDGRGVDEAFEALAHGAARTRAVPA